MTALTLQAAAQSCAEICAAAQRNSGPMTWDRWGTPGGQVGNVLALIEACRRCQQGSSPAPQQQVGEYCRNGSICGPGLRCSWLPGRCYTAGKVDCGTYSCEQGTLCRRDGGCATPAQLAQEEQDEREAAEFRKEKARLQSEQYDREQAALRQKREDDARTARWLKEAQKQQAAAEKLEREKKAKEKREAEIARKKVLRAAAEQKEKDRQVEIIRKKQQAVFQHQGAIEAKKKAEEDKQRVAKTEEEAKQKVAIAKRADDELVKKLGATKGQPPSTQSKQMLSAEDQKISAVLSGSKSVTQTASNAVQTVPLRAKPINLSAAREVQPYSILAIDSYSDKGKPNVVAFGYVRLADDWKVTFKKAGVSSTQISEFDRSNFFASTYVNKEKKEIVIAYRGSEMPATSASSLRDWATNIGARYLAADGRILPTQYDAALSYAKAVQLSAQKDFKGYRIKLTGHSEGGGEASYVANKLGLDAYTFNAARNPFSTQRGDTSAAKQVNVTTINDFVGDADVSKLAGKGLLPGQSFFVGHTGGADMGLVDRHSMDAVGAGIGEFLLKSAMTKP